MDDLIKYNLNKTCRACLAQDVQLKDLHAYKIYVELNCITQFEFCTKLKVSKTDNLPLKICVKCVAKLNAACSFIQLCQGSDAIMRKIDWSVPQKDIVKLECSDKNVKAECSDANIDVSSVSNGDKTLTRSQCHKNNTCNICSKSYRTMGHLKLHLKLHSTKVNDGHSCNMCGKKFTQKSTLTNHMKRHYGLKQSDYLDGQKRDEHACRVCYKTFATLGLLYVHFKNHSVKERLTCQLCNQIFKSRGSLIEHLKLHMGDKINDKFNVTKWISLVNRHKENMTTNISVEKVDGENLAVDEEISKNFNLDNTLYNCTQCAKSFIYRSSLSFHLKKHDMQNKNGFHCKICNREFKLLVYLKHHKKIHNEDEKYSCSICLKKFHRKTNLNRHMLNHRQHKESQYLCYKCGVTAKNYASFKLHMLKHSDVLAYSCDVCKKKFRTKGSLLSHAKVHTGVKKYRCSVCTKRYVNSSGLKYHMRSHDAQKRIKERPYQCRECDKTFETEKNLKIHFILHTGDFPHRCQICEQGFNRFSSYKMHMKRHTDGKSFICDICGFAVFSASALTIHKRTHTGEKPYYCDICPHKFTTSGGLLRHKKRVHVNLQNDMVIIEKPAEDISNPVNDNVNTDDVKCIQGNTQHNISENN